MKRYLIFLTIVLSALCLPLAAQDLDSFPSGDKFTGGVTGKVINRMSKEAVGDAKLTIYKGAVAVATTGTAEDGSFRVENLADGMYDVVVEAPSYLETRVNVTVNDGYVKNMFNITLSYLKSETTDELFEEFDMDDSGYQDNPTILFGQNDVFNNIAGYNFSSVRFNVRGYESQTQDVYLAGVKMNDALTGYTPYSLWTGLNEAMRTKSTANGMEMSDYGIGGFNGLTNINGVATSVRKGWRGSVLTNSAMYRLRLMLTYASGQLDNGWSYAISGSARLGGNDWIEGVYYRSFAYYGSVEKKFNDTHKLGLTFFATPGQRGAQNASTQEVYDLMDDNMYNSNWGYQNGKVRNARVRKTHEPVAFLKYDYTPSTRFSASATLLFRFGKNGYTALDWYDAPDPRPDYYRNLPSYYYMDIADYGRVNENKAAWAADSWINDDPSVTHINWDRLYAVNKMNSTDYGNRSKYIVEERRVDQRDLNLALSAKWKANSHFELSGGLDGKINRTENYKIVSDLLGGDYYVNINQYAERDYPSDESKIQYDLDYYNDHGTAQLLKEGDKYGYDYYAHVRKANAWAAGKFAIGGLEANLGVQAGYEGFWREGLWANGLFPDNSKGDSEKSDFFVWSTKLNLSYVLRGGHRFYGNIGYFEDAPTFNQAFLSARTRNDLVPDLTTTKTFSADLNYQYSNNGYDLRVTGYFTTIKDRSDVMSFYDDSQNSFTNFAMSGIDERHMGIELGFKVPTPVTNLSLQGVLAWGEYLYTSNPYMTQTVDNDAEVVIDHVVIPYWKSNPTLDGGTQKHHVPSTPELATSLGLSYNYNYWFIDLDGQYFANSYLDMNPLYRTDMATMGADGIATLTEIDYMASQEKFDPAFLLNVSVGKSWYIHYKYQIGFSLQVKNILNNREVKTGGYEQTRLVDNTENGERYYKFDPKYFYMSGINYMLNIYFRF